MKQAEIEQLFTARQGEFDPQTIRRMRTRIIRAGQSLEIESYPVLQLNRAKRRHLKHVQTREAQHKLNRRNRTKHVRRLIEANFTEADYVVTGTYDYSFIDAGFTNIGDEIARYDEYRLPWDFNDALRDVQNYIRRIRYRQKRTIPQEDVKYIYVIEETKKPAPGLPPCYHFHMVLHAPGLSREQVHAIWESVQGHGFTRCDNLSLEISGRYGNAASMAEYLTKQKTGRLNTSKNLKQPEIETADHILSPAKAAEVARETRVNGMAIFESIYPDYRCTQPPDVFFSDYLPGAYIYAYMRRKRPASRSRIA